MKPTSDSHPRSLNCFSATAMPARTFSAVIARGNAGSEKSTVSGSRPSSKIRVMSSPLFWRFAWRHRCNQLEAIITDISGLTTVDRNAVRVGPHRYDGGGIPAEGKEACYVIILDAMRTGRDWPV